jgi:hypothetical protein
MMPVNFWVNENIDYNLDEIYKMEEKRKNNPNSIKNGELLNFIITLNDLYNIHNIFWLKRHEPEQEKLIEKYNLLYTNLASERLKESFEDGLKSESTMVGVLLLQLTSIYVKLAAERMGSEVEWGYDYQEIDHRQTNEELEEKIDDLKEQIKDMESRNSEYDYSDIIDAKTNYIKKLESKKVI